MVLEPADFPGREGTHDAYAEDAKSALRELFGETGEVYYLKQLEVRFEKKFFHWVTSRAVNDLIEEGFLRVAEEQLAGQTRVKFVFYKRHRYYRRQVSEMLSVIREYSKPDVARGCGRQAEVLFLNALVGRRFMVEGENTNQYRGKQWSMTNHDLDFIIEKDGTSYGCEVKNTWDYIDRKEMQIKMKLCEFLGVVPLFIMRYAPKTYLYEIERGGGVFVLFESQVYPFGQSGLVGRIQKVLGLPVDSPMHIPTGIVDRFMKVHGRRSGRGV